MKEVDLIITKAREGCCGTWPKPCQYHEGYLDALWYLMGEDEDD